jgi:hypothetical protein
MSARSLTGLALIAALAVVPATAFAGGGPGEVVEVESKVKIKEEFPAFHGKVKAENTACVDNRLVKLFKEKRNGDRKLLGKDRTDVDGKWEVLVDPLKSGAYWAVVKRFEDATAGPIYDCLKGKSKVVAVD